MRKILTALLALVVLAAGSSTSLAATPTLEQQVAALRTRAEAAAAKKQWSLAIRYVSEARKHVRTARRAALTPVVKTPDTPAYRKDLEELRTWILKQEKLARAKTKSRSQIAQELQARQSALDRKHGIKRRGTRPVAAATARYDLLAASLEDLLSGYFAGKGNPREAAAHKRAALVTRLQVFQAQGKQGEAAQVAEKLLTAAPGDPDSYSASGSFFQGRGQFQRALKIWEQGVRAVTQGAAQPRPMGASMDRTTARNQYLGHFYRQQAFCLSRLGRTTEAKAAMQKAASLDVKVRRS